MSKQQFQVLVNAVIVKDNEILLSRRAFTEKNAPGKWTIPGGGLEYDNEHETLEKAVQREILEEVGIEVYEQMTMLTNNTFIHDGDDNKVLAIIFFCKYKSGKEQSLEDTIDVRWINEDQLNDFEFNHPNVKDYVKKGFDKNQKIQNRSK